MTEKQAGVGHTASGMEAAEGAFLRLRAVTARLLARAAGAVNLPLRAADEALAGLLDTLWAHGSDVLLWQARLNRDGAYELLHALDCCVYALALGRHLKLSRESLHSLGKAALLLDVGMCRVPQEILNKPGKLSEGEFEAVKRHVAWGLEMLDAASPVSDAVLGVVRSHHERHNGSGYPHGLRGDEIPPLGRLAAIVDCYTAMTRQRVYRHAESSYEVLNRIYAWRDSFFSRELVELFVRFIGVYPTATLVELSSGEVGAVLAQNPGRSLRPCLLLLLEADKSPCRPCRLLDLAQPWRAGGRRLEIARGHGDGAFGIELRPEMWRQAVAAAGATGR